MAEIPTNQIIIQNKSYIVINLAGQSILEVKHDAILFNYRWNHLNAVGRKCFEVILSKTDINLPTPAYAPCEHWKKSAYFGKFQAATFVVVFCVVLPSSYCAAAASLRSPSAPICWSIRVRTYLLKLLDLVLTQATWSRVTLTDFVIRSFTVSPPHTLVCA